MKNRIKIALVSLLMLFPMISNAQWRAGYEITGLFQNSEGFSENTWVEPGISGGCQIDYRLEYVFPRKWFPSDISVSLVTGIGGTIFDYEYEYVRNSYTYYWGSNGYSHTDVDSYIYGESDDVWAFQIPLGGEIKYLLTNNFRVYANVGLSYYFGNCGLEDQGFGTQFGFGIEWKWFRLGYKHVTVPEELFAGNIEDFNATNAIAIGILFSGNRLHKKQSKLDFY